MFEALEYDFFRHALYAGLLASIACGIIGTFVVVKQISSISGGLSHAAFGGLGLGYLLGFSPVLGAAVFCLVCSFIIAIAYRKKHQTLDTLISMVWSIGMALGVLFISLAPGPVPDLNSYLFGSILFVPKTYLVFVAALDLLLLGVLRIYFRELQAISFDEEFAEVTGVQVGPLFLLLLALTSLVVITLIRVVGVIMLIALLTLPAVTARHWSEGLKQMIVLASAIAAFSTTAGLFLSYGLSESFAAKVPTGPLIILLAAVCFGFSHILRSRFLAKPS